MSIAAIIYIGLLIISLIVSVSQHGEHKTGYHNFIEELIGTVIIVSLLVWGGFFSTVDETTFSEECPTAQVVVPVGYKLVPDTE